MTWPWPSVSLMLLWATHSGPLQRRREVQHEYRHRHLPRWVLVQIDRKTRLANMAVRRYLLYRAANITFQTAGALRSLTHSPPMLNCPLWIRRDSSMPAIVIAAVLNHLNPSIGSMRSFTPR